MVSSEHSNDSEEIVQSNNQGKIINNELDIPSYDRVSGTIPFEELYNSEPRKNDPHQDLISFPEVDTTVQYFTKIHKTPYAAKPDIAYADCLDPYVKVCFECFSADWTLVKHNYYGYERYQRTLPELDALPYEGDSGTGLRLPKPKLQRDSQGAMYRKRGGVYMAPPLKEILEANITTADPFFTYNKPYSKHRERKHRKELEKNRYEFFEYYDPDFNWQPGTEVALCYRIRKTSPPDQIKQDTKFKIFYFIVEPDSIIFQLGELEPLFCSLALYQFDPSNSSVKKISETFSFQTNSPAMLKLISSHWKPSDSEHETKKGLFSVQRRNANIYLVLEVYKVLQGDPDTAVDPYAKITMVNTQKEQGKVKGKIENEAEEYCKRLGKYRQAFAWTATQVFDAKGNLLLPETTQIDTIYSRNPREPIENLVQMFCSNDQAKKLGKDLHGICTLKVSQTTKENLSATTMLDASQQLIKPEINDNQNPMIVKEIYEFIQYPSFIPNFYYINNMYIYPLFAIIGFKTNRNVTVKMEVKDNDLDNSPSLKCIYDPFSSVEFVDNIYTSVHYHNKSPHFSEEFKIMLPAKLSEKHHLLFTFYHIPTKKKKEESELILGYAVVPLYQGGRIVVHNMESYYGSTIHHSKLEPGYLSKLNNEVLKEREKPGFAVKFSLVSTIYPEDQSICEFLNIYHTTEEIVPDSKLVTVIKNLQGLSELLAVQYLPVIINNLLEIMVTRANHKPKLEAFKTLVMVLHKVKCKLAETVPRNSLLEFFTNYIFQQTFTTQHAVYETLCSNFLLYMMEKKLEDTQEDSIFVNSWFIFDLVIKSMILELEKNEKQNQSLKKGLFDDFYVRTLSRLLVNLTKYFKEKMGSKEGNEIRILNKNLGLFLKDLLYIFDRGIVLDMIKSYLHDMTDPTQELLSVTYKFEFLKIIIDHEHFVCLNLLFCPLPEVSIKKLRESYPLAEILISETLESLKSNNQQVWTLGIHTLYDIVVKNAFDARYNDESKRKRVASIYFMLIPMFINHWDYFENWRTQSSIEMKRELYVCMLYVLKSCDHTVLRRWWKDEITKNLILFLHLIKDIIEMFEYSQAITRTKRSLFTPQVALFMNNAGTEEMNSLLKSIAVSKDNPQEEDKRNRWLTIEVYTLLLEVIELFISDHKKDLIRSHANNPIMPNIIDIYCKFLQKKQSIHFCHFIYSSLRIFTHKFSVVLFKGDNNYLSQLFDPILLHCNSSISDIHIEASSVLFLFILLNQKTVGNFGRTKIQAIISLSNLVQSKKIEKDISLNISFIRLSEYALAYYGTLNYRNELSDNKVLEYDDEAADTYFLNFTRAVQDMAKSLLNILRDTLRVNELIESADPQTICDLYMQIASGYKNTPDLRLTWLNKLALYQQTHGNFIESAIIFTHEAALIADYLITSGKLNNQLVDTRIFQRISPQIKEFSNSEEEEDVCQSTNFTESGLIATLRNAIRCFKASEYYEFSANLYKLLFPIYEKNQAYHDLSQSGNQLNEIWNKIELDNEKRLFGTYFRVGFFGELFGDDLHNREFVYKEPKLTHILDLTERLKTFYSQKLSREVILIDASHSINDIDRLKCYLQITKIDPYMQTAGKTFFECNVNLATFVFETPFTKSGKSHADDVSQQFKRKTILTVAGSFPAMVTRLPVVKKRDVIFTPIESAIEDILKRNNQLEFEINKKPINQKTLTQVLQGSALPQVNEGAMAICRMFLANHKSHPFKYVLQLKEALQQLLDLIQMGLAQNKLLISTDNDKKFHFEMETGFKSLNLEINSYFQNLEKSNQSDSLDQEDLPSDDSDLSLSLESLKSSEKKKITSTHPTNSINTSTPTSSPTRPKTRAKRSETNPAKPIGLIGLAESNKCATPVLPDIQLISPAPSSPLQPKSPKGMRTSAKLASQQPKISINPGNLLSPSKITPSSSSDSISSKLKKEPKRKQTPVSAVTTTSRYIKTSSDLNTSPKIAPKPHPPPRKEDIKNTRSSTRPPALVNTQSAPSKLPEMTDTPTKKYSLESIISPRDNMPASWFVMQGKKPPPPSGPPPSKDN